METIKNLLRNLITIISFLLFSLIAYSQLPDCNLVYFHNGTNIYNYDPTTNTTVINSIHPPIGAGGLAVARNFFSSAPNPTFYTVIGSTYRYWDGTAWVNTNHYAGSSAAVNPGGAGPYIYNVDGLNNKIYRYDGTGNSTLFLDLNINGSYDCMGDENGGLYIINGNELRMYDANANLVCHYTLIDYDNTGAGGGYSVVNGVVFANNGITNYKGIINGNTIDFTPYTIPNGPAIVSDFANCPFPALNVNITYPGDLSCSLNQVPLTASTTVDNPVYIWSGAGIVSGETTSEVIVNQPGVYSVSITSSGGGGSGGCGNNASSSVTIALNGISNFTGTASCMNDSILYEGTIAISNDMNTGTMTISSSCGGNQIFNLPIIGSEFSIVNYQFSGLNDGATDCNIFISFSDYESCNQMIPIAVPNCATDVTQPIINITNSTCTILGTATISNYDTSYTYTFSPPGPTVNTNGEISGMVVGTEYTVTATNGTSTSDASESFSIQGQTPPPPAPIIESLQTFCQGATVSNLQPFSSEYHWFSPDNSALNPSDILSSGTYSVSQTIGECESEKAIVKIIISAPPVITVSSDTSICRGENIILTASGANTYSWSPQNQSGSSITVNPNVTTTYTVTGTTAEGCSSTNQVTITILPTPTASFSASSQMGSPPLQVDFVNSSVNAIDYNWLIDNDFQTNSNDFEFTFLTEGIFTVTLIASNDWCSDTASKIIHVALSTTGEIPNVFSPNNDGVNDLWEIEGVVKSVVILNRWGNVVFTSNENFNGWNGKDKNGNDCSDGVYFYRVEDGEGNYWVGFLTILR